MYNNGRLIVKNNQNIVYKSTNNFNINNIFFGHFMYQCIITTNSPFRIWTDDSYKFMINRMLVAHVTSGAYINIVTFPAHPSYS